MKILLVDDDAALLQAYAAVLQNAPGGHSLQAASGPVEAQAKAEELGGIDLLISDVVMEPMDGFTLRNELAQRYADFETIYVTGYDLTGYEEQLGTATLLQKPVASEALLEAVAKVAAKKGGSTPLPANFAARLGGAAAAPTAAPAAPHAVPTAFPVSQPSVPSATPVAKPVAAVPVAKPAAAVPVAKSAAAVPVAKPAAAAPVPVAKPAAATPVAKPLTAPTATPKAAVPAAAPKAAVPVAAAKPAATPVAAPKPAVAAAAPKAAVPVAAPKPAAAAAPVAALPPAEAAGSDELGLVGQTVGGYQVVACLGEGRWGPVYAARQVAINRPVGLKVLSPTKAADEEQKQRFVADARAKANVQSPAILSVYEAGAAENWIYYTHEYVAGQSLAELAASGEKLEEPQALKLLRTVAEGMQYLEKNVVPHTPLEASDIYLGTDGQPRLANLASQLADEPVTTAQELETVAKALLPVLSQNVGGPFRMLVARCLSTHQSPVADWTALLAGLKAVEPKVVPVGAAKISAQDRAAEAAVSKARAQQKKAFLINVTAMVALVASLIGAVWYVFFRDRARILDEQVHIPAGTFIAGDGRSTTNREFWIDKYEVTIEQYNEFVVWIKENPSKEHDYDHPQQPKQFSHIPIFWHIYYPNAKARKQVHFVNITPNSPALGISFWSAYAFAKWQGRELPSEAEWERAARTTDGRLYPWGAEADATKANVKTEPQRFWADVDKLGGDETPEGVVGMAGNVSEWTNTWTPDRRYPIVKGGNYFTPLQPLNTQTKFPDGQPFPPFIETSPECELVGFRTISTTPP